MVVVMIIALVGMLVCGYSLSIERQLKKNASYKPMCDISDAASCSRPLQSKYSSFFGISNGLIGLFFYIAVVVLAWLGQCQLIWYASWASVCASVYFAYLLFFKIRSLCLICISVYIINSMLCLASYKCW